MEVELYVYDLSGGLARQYSVAITGVYIDAIYHTAVVLGGVEYFFGQGIHRKVPGSTHHGRPMEVFKMGQTDLPIELIEEYIQSLESIYTPESYDLFLHNCNNFSQDLCMFLVGKSIPENISSLPETFLKTPIGQMMRGQIDQSMRRMTQAPDAASGQNARSRGIASSQIQTNGGPQRLANGIPSNRRAFINSAPQSQVSQNKSKHPHSALNPSRLKKRMATPMLATTTPSLDKLISRISSAYGENIQPLNDLVSHVKLLEAESASNAPLPDMKSISSWITSNFDSTNKAAFAIVDLLRIACLDSRISAYLATEDELSILKKVYSNEKLSSPYNLSFTRLQLALNLSSSTVAQDALLDHADGTENALRGVVGDEAAKSLLEPNSKLRLQAALLVTNLAAIDHNQRLDGREDILCLHSMADGAIESALVQAVTDEDDQATLEKLLLALGLILYLAPEDASIRELCEAMDVGEALESKTVAKESLAKEVLYLLNTS